MLYYVCICAGRYKHTRISIWSTEDNLHGSIFPFLPCGSWESNSSYEACRQTPLPAEPLHSLWLSFNRHKLPNSYQFQFYFQACLIRIREQCIVKMGRKLSSAKVLSHTVKASTGPREAKKDPIQLSFPLKELTCTIKLLLLNISSKLSTCAFKKNYHYRHCDENTK